MLLWAACAATVLTTTWRVVDATSFKLDYLPAGHVRTDPLLHSSIGYCTSDHVHTFFGAASDAAMRPNATYEDLRRAQQNSGNTKENLSLYWHPSIYTVVRQPNGSESFELADLWFASAYYVWRTGEATAFPDGFKMRTSDADPLARATAHCAPEPGPCERADTCDPLPQQDFLPAEACWELEINIKFPACWDGLNLESPDGSHVAWSVGCEEAIDEENFDPECFEFDCPATHPVRFPEVHFYTRVLDYKGGPHTFSDDSDTFHADYFSGWNETELQGVLDECENESDASGPDFFCSDQLTFRGSAKEEGVQNEDLDIAADLRRIQPSKAVDPRLTIAPEAVTQIPSLPRGVCKGEIIT